MPEFYLIITIVTFGMLQNSFINFLAFTQISSLYLKSPLSFAKKYKNKRIFLLHVQMSVN